MKIEDVMVGQIVRRTQQGNTGVEAEVIAVENGQAYVRYLGSTDPSCQRVNWYPYNFQYVKGPTPVRIPLKKGQRVTRTVSDVLYTGVCIENERPDGDIIILCDGDANSVVTVAAYWELVSESPPTLRNTHMTATFTEAESRAQMAFFSTPVTPNTCPKCGPNVPKPCKYHE